MNADFIRSLRSAMPESGHAEVRAQESRASRVTILGGNLTNNTSTTTSGVCARVYRDGIYGFSSMAECTAEAAGKVLHAADENAAFLGRRAGREAPAIPVIPAQEISTEGAVFPEQKVFTDFAKAVDAYVAQKYPDLSSRAIVATSDCMEKALLTNDGAYGHFTAPRAYLYVFLNSETKDGNPIELFHAFGGKGTFDKVLTDPAALNDGIDELYEHLMKKREGVYPEAGIKTVILGGMMTGMLAHEAVGHTVEADLVLGGSVAAHNLGKRVGSDLVSMVDLAHHYNGELCPLPVFLDDEGTPATDAPLIKDGILVGYMNSRESAQHFGMTPTGNARAWAFSDEPLIRMRNTAVLPGKDKLEDMIASVDDGYYFINSNNGQADTTGEFMFGVTTGYEIKHGKLGRALLDTTISGVAFEMLKTVDMVSDTMTWESSGFCGKKQPMPVGMGGPALRCKVNVGGR